MTFFASFLYFQTENCFSTRTHVGLYDIRRFEISLYLVWLHRQSQVISQHDKNCPIYCPSLRCINMFVLTIEEGTKKLVKRHIFKTQSFAICRRWAIEQRNGSMWYSVYSCLLRNGLYSMVNTRYNSIRNDHCTAFISYSPDNFISTSLKFLL